MIPGSRKDAQGKVKANVFTEPDGKDKLTDQYAKRPGVTQQITATNGQTMDALRPRSDKPLYSLTLEPWQEGPESFFGSGLVIERRRSSSDRLRKDRHPDDCNTAGSRPLSCAHTMRTAQATGTDDIRQRKTSIVRAGVNRIRFAGN